MISKKIYFVALKYTPGEAITNRLLSFAKGLGELDVKVTVFFLTANHSNDIVNNIPKNVTFRYLRYELPDWLSKNKYISVVITSLLLLRLLHKRDKVFLANYFLPLFTLLSYKNIDLYFERSENPDLFFNNSIFSQLIKKFYIYRCKQVKGLFVISNHIKNFFVSNKIPLDKISILNMTVDHSRFDGISKKENVDEYIAYCGSATNYKDGVDILIKAFHKVVQHFPNLKLYIIGNEANKKDRDNNRNLIQKLSLTNQVLFTGKVPAEQIPEYLCNAKILALSRPDNIQSAAGFPTKLGEYLIAEKPILATKVGEIEFFLKDNVNCFLAEPDNVDEFANKLKWILNNYQVALKVAIEGKKIALSEFNYKTQSKKMYDAIFC